MKAIDISVTISSETPVYPGDPVPRIEPMLSIEDEGCQVSSITLGSHTGTHIDAPSHILDEGKGVDEISLDGLTGKAALIDLSDQRDSITHKDLERAYDDRLFSPGTDILLIKTGSITWTSPVNLNPDDLVSLDTTAAQWIADKGFRTVGIDCFSVDSGSGLDVHKMFLGNGINIVECLDLDDVDEGVYFFVCLPLKIKDCDGAPARALLFSEDPFV